MKIVRARVIPIRLPLARPLASAHGPIDVRTGAVLELEGEAGERGWGEALPLPGFGLESTDDAVDALETIAGALVDDPPETLAAALARTLAAAPKAPAARAAADVALHDLAARQAGAPIAALLGPAPRRSVPVNALVSGDTPDELADSARGALRRGYRTLKLKLLGGELANDVARVARVREAVGDGPRLRLDANAAWSEADAIAALARLTDFGIELIEQPTGIDDVDALARVRAASSIPIAADEAVRDPRSAERLLAAHAVDVLVLKPAATGGLDAARRIAAAAHRRGVAVIVTSFLDSSLGIAAALQLAAALPEGPHAAGLATAELLADDLAEPLAIEAGAIALPRTPGLGLHPEADALARLVRAPVREVSR